jgi:hypothetical protein
MEETAASSGAAPSPDAPTEHQSLEDMIERWWADHFPGSPVAQVTRAWNHAFAAKEELKRRLVDLAKGVL